MSAQKFVTKYALAGLMGRPPPYVLNLFTRNILTKDCLVEMNGRDVVDIDKAIIDIDAYLEFAEPRADSKLAPALENLKKQNKLRTEIVPAKVAVPETKTEVIDGKEVPVTTYPSDDDKFSRFRNAKTSAEEQRARKLELDVGEREGRLLDKEEARKTIIRMVHEVREAFLNLPPRISPLAVAITDPLEMENFLIKEINLVLEGLSRVEGKFK